MTQLYQQDTFTLDAEKITEYKHPTFGDVTVFHGVVIASEIVQKYEDGRAYKSRDELEKYSWTVDGRWVTLGSHPKDGIISTRDQVHGRTVNPRYVKDLQDPKTKRPCRAGVRSDVEIFNDRVPANVLTDMKNGKRQDVSIGFFFTKDDTAGIVADGPFKGEEYDYAQGNMFHDHLAAALDNGRCPMPYCGLGADELVRQITGDPFAGFSGWEDCVATIMEENPKYTEEQAEAVCGKLKKEHEDNKGEDLAMRNSAKALVKALVDELEELQAMKDAKKDEEVKWFVSIPWKEDPYLTLYDSLNEETQKLIADEGLCPNCDEEGGGEEEPCEEGYEKNEEGECVKMKEEDALGSDMSIEQINAKLVDLKEKRDALREKTRKLEDAMYNDSPSEKKRKDKAREEVNQLWDEMNDLGDEIYAYSQAKSMKIVEGALQDSTGAVKQDTLNPYEVLERFHKVMEKK